MAGRNHAAIAAALEAMAHALENQSNADENAGSLSLATFQRENPPTFKGTYDPDGALTWLKEIERIFRVMDYTPAQKVRYGTHMLALEADDCEATAEFSQCMKFENGLRSEIKKAVGYQKICVFANLVDSCRIYKEDNNAHYKIVNERGSKHQQNRGKPYDAPVGKCKHKVADGKRTSGGDAPAGVICFKCGKSAHKSIVCTVEVKRCFRCGKTGHAMFECKHNEMVCFNCGEEGHIGSQKLKLNLTLTSMNGEMVVDTPAKGSVTNSLVCLKCPLSVFDRHFIVDLICFPLRGLYVILGMNWLEHNHVHINSYDKSVRFSTPEEDGVDLLSAKQLRLLMKEEVQVFSLIALLSMENQDIIDELQVVREFPEVFPDEILNVPPKREVEFTIDLVPSTILVSMAPYMMSSS
ncbi:uncharacterized protein LOC131641294 [Vicia villosa]|uniref:uncharacterized protein LOC131641294 n=1 Tax=Vicia villosa TaxID=3911 RepID=UPI00273C10EB|nr:uncharacterized protein LOC131641294 [Vicia villosa]